MNPSGALCSSQSANFGAWAGMPLQARRIWSARSTPRRVSHLPQLGADPLLDRCGRVRWKALHSRWHWHRYQATPGSTTRHSRPIRRTRPRACRGRPGYRGTRVSRRSSPKSGSRTRRVAAADAQARPSAVARSGACRGKFIYTMVHHLNRHLIFFVYVPNIEKKLPRFNFKRTSQYNQSRYSYVSMTTFYMRD